MDTVATIAEEDVLRLLGAEWDEDGPEMARIVVLHPDHKDDITAWHDRRPALAWYTSNPIVWESGDDGEHRAVVETDFGSICFIADPTMRSDRIEVRGENERRPRRSMTIGAGARA